MTDDGIPVWGIEEPDIDLGDLVLEDENDALAANRTREMKRSVHAWLCFHSGLFSEWGLTHDAVDESATSSSERMHSELTSRRQDTKEVFIILLENISIRSF